MKVLLIVVLLLGGCSGYEDSVDTLNEDTTQNRNRINELEKNSGRIADLERELEIVKSIQMDLIARLGQSESVDNQIQQDLLTLRDAIDNGIKKIHDPCGNMPGNFDEVIIELHNGTYLAYFESGSKRFLAVIGVGNYRTTDAQKCYFSIPLI